MKNYKFDSRRHLHSLNEIPLHGVTTILGVIAKPELIGWAARAAVDNIRSQWKPGVKYTKKQINEILDGGKDEHSNIKKSAGDTGTTVHEAISKWIKDNCPSLDSYSKYHKDKELVSKMFMNFVSWAKENNVIFHLSEHNVYSEKHWYGGIIDFTCEINGYSYLGDIKTSSGIYPEYWFQCGAYDIALNEMTGFTPVGYIIVNIKKDGTMQIQITKETAIYKEAFIHALELYKIWSKIKGKKRK